MHAPAPSGCTARAAVVILAAMCMLPGCVGRGADRDEANRRALEQAGLPGPARAAILARAGDVEIVRVERIAGAAGATTYQATIGRGDGATLLIVDREGRLLSQRVGPEGGPHAGAEQLGIDQVPDRARAGILQRSGGADIKDIRKGTRDGKTVYDVTLGKHDRSDAFLVDRDGRMIERLRVLGNLAIEDVPAAARTTLVRLAGSGTIREVEHAEDRGRDLYTALVDLAPADRPEAIREQRSCRIAVDRAGQVLSRRTVERPLAAKDLLDPALSTIRRQTGGRTIQRLEQQDESGSALYEAWVVDDGDLVVIHVGEDGEPVER
jgi:uncharacterized membrane protein YkoI